MNRRDHSRRITCDDHSRYTAGCHPCRKRSAARGRARTRGLAYGTWQGMVDAAPAQQHVAALSAVGWSGRRIAAASSVARSVVQRLVAGTATEIHSQTLTAILALPVTPRYPSGHDMVAAVGAARRLQALTALGHATSKIAAELGVDVQSVRRWRRQKFPFVIASRHHSIADLYDRLSTVPGTCDRARAAAARAGWVPPLAWDDTTIDDPAATPDLGDPDTGLIDPIAVDRALAGHDVTLTETERIHAVHVGLDRGMAVTAVAVALGMNNQRVRAIRDRAQHTQAA